MNDPFATETSDTARAVDALCDRFEDAWRAGERPDLDEWMSAAGSVGDAALPELAALDLDYRVRSGDPATAADYFARFPTLTRLPAVAVRLVAAEFRAARARGTEVSEADFRRRYPDLAARPEWSNGPWVDRPPATPPAGADTTEQPAGAADTADAPAGPPAADGTREFLAAVLAPPAEPGDLGRFGGYRVLGVLGRGGMGVVLRAEEEVLRRPVALKLMRPEVAARPLARDRFLREARAAAAVEHPRVVAIYQVGEVGGVPFIAMPLLRGRSLARRLADGPPVGIGEAVRLAREAAEGLAAAHATGLIHRDVKPDNVWLEDGDGGPHVRLLDFGLARGGPGEPLTDPGVVLGTPAYMAPEQAAGKVVDTRADLFALGCVLYELLTGRRAFAGSDLMGVLTALATHHPAPPAAVNPTVPSGLSALVARLLSKDPGGRPGSAAEVAATLRGFETAAGGQAPTASAPVPGSAPAREPWHGQAALNGWLGGRARVGCAVSVTLALVVGVALSALVPPARRPVGQTEVASQAGDTRLPSPEMADPSGLNQPPRDASGGGASTTLEVGAGPGRAGGLRVESISVRLHSRVNETEGDDAGIIGREAFGAATGDQVTVEAKLSRPAFAYLIAFAPNGQSELCFPDDEARVPRPTDRPRYPPGATERLKRYGLNEGAGLMAFAVLASDAPLPAYKDWAVGKTPPWSRTAAPLHPGRVWWDDGQWAETLTPGGPVRGDRGKGEDAIGPIGAVTRLTDWLRAAGPPGAAAGAVGFVVGPGRGKK